MGPSLERLAIPRLLFVERICFCDPSGRQLEINLTPAREGIRNTKPAILFLGLAHRPVSDAPELHGLFLKFLFRVHGQWPKSRLNTLNNDTSITVRQHDQRCPTNKTLSSSNAVVELQECSPSIKTVSGFSGAISAAIKSALSGLKRAIDSILSREVEHDFLTVGHLSPADRPSFRFPLVKAVSV